MVIAIDGPAGSGKSTIAKMLARKLGFLFLDTGAMYRALTLKVIKERIPVDHEEKITGLAASLDFRFDGDKVILDGKDVSAAIRTPEIDKAISPVCRIPGVRHHLVELQRKLALDSSCVCEGRDTTTVVFPDADVKVYLTANVEERARRRLADFQKKGIDVDYETVRSEVIRRDQADMSREVGPLKKADDAYELDTTGLTIEQVAQRIYTLAREKQYDY